MCVGLSGKVVSVERGMALVDASGARREVSAELLQDLEPGDYVMVHAGIAIAKIACDDAEENRTVMAGVLAGKGDTPVGETR
ncbi:MAG: HypC/HybG/HupF family hydrogenase formation chaperone [Desulfovibrio sp.]|nr:HypC/HybG/HupF family hydrogenase formation chaperone [Desulfovibrio sp.]